MPLVHHLMQESKEGGGASLFSFGLTFPPIIITLSLVVLTVIIPKESSIGERCVKQREEAQEAPHT